MSAGPRKVIRRRALRLLQDEQHPVYVFSLTAQELLNLADISRISRDDAGKVIGYQRPEVKQHVQDIVNYLNGDQVLFPNSIILALCSDVHFKRGWEPVVDDGVAAAGAVPHR
jgi:DGQHR domain-containing protein